MSMLMKSKVGVRFFDTKRSSVEEVQQGLDFILARSCEIPARDEAVGEEVKAGWSGPSHLADVDFSAGHCIEDGVLKLFWVRAERVVPAAVLKQKLAEAIEQRLKDGLGHPSKKVRKQMVVDLVHALKPSQPVTRKAIEFWWDFTGGFAVASQPAESKAVELAHLLALVVDPIKGGGVVPLVMGMQDALTGRLVAEISGQDAPAPDWTVAGPLVLSSDERTVRVGGAGAPKKKSTAALVLEEKLAVDSCVVLAEAGGLPVECAVDWSCGVRGLHVPKGASGSVASRMAFFQQVRAKIGEIAVAKSSTAEAQA